MTKLGMEKLGKARDEFDNGCSDMLWQNTLTVKIF